MGRTTAKSTHFMEPLINQRDSQVMVRSWDCKGAQGSFSDINVKENPNKPPFLPKKSIVVHPHYLPNFPKKGGEIIKSPKLPWKAGDMNPLIYKTNRNRIRIKVWDPWSEDKVEAFDKPRTISPNIVSIKNGSKSKKDLPIP